MASNKTVETDKSVAEFLSQVMDEKRRQDSYVVLEMMKQVTGLEPKMWGDSIVGFGRYHYKYASGREGDSLLAGFSPRKQSLTVYIMAGFDAYDDLLKHLGKYKTGKSCLYINKIEDIDLAVLRTLVEKSFEHMQKTNL